MGGMGRAEQKHVLVVDADFEASHNLYFLLKMKNCQVSQARNTEEVINWVTIRALIDEPIDLLVINNFTFSHQSLQLLTEFGLLRLELPVLIVNRRGEAACIENRLRGLGPDCPITVCEPAHLPDMLDRLLQRGGQPVQQAGMTTHRSGYKGENHGG